MANLIDSPEFTSNEIYEIQASDSVEGAASGASFGGIGVSNQPHQQLANRTAYLKNRQDTNIASIATLNAFKALFASTINVNGNNIFKFGVLDSVRGQIDLIVQYGYFNIGSAPVAGDTEYAVSYGMQFPNAVLGPPLLTNIYVSTSGRNTAASAVVNSWTTAGFAVMFDVPNGATGSFNGNERTAGVSYLAFGY